MANNEVVLFGQVDSISPVKKINDNFSLLTVVINDLDPVRPQFVEVEFSNGRMENAEPLKIGDKVEITAKIHGRKAVTKSGENVFNKFSAYKVKIV